MSLEQPKLTTDLKTMLLKEFAESDISHGEWFDDDRLRVLCASQLKIICGQIKPVLSVRVYGLNL